MRPVAATISGLWCMRLLFLCKRFPQGRDLIERPYGRFYHLAKTLASRGHEVRMALLSYRGLPSEDRGFDAIRWSSDDLRPWGPLPYLRRLGRIAVEMRPDWVVGASDTYFGILARALARKHGARCAIDAYDDFESYIPWAWPLHRMWRQALADADLITVPGPQLGELLRSRGARSPHVVPMTADPEFRVLDRMQCRDSLGLPCERRLVGYVGAFDQQRGCEVVLQALKQVRKVRSDVSLVLSGRQSLDLHRPPAIYGLGYIADERMPMLVNSLDVACVALADNSFGRSSYPVKLCEAIACQIPVVASASAPARWMLQGQDRFLAEIGDASAMAARILENLDLGRAKLTPPPSWEQSAASLEALYAVPA
jgi:glycosyltransferase involved in cell wall biosynthesis